MGRQTCTEYKVSSCAAVPRGKVSLSSSLINAVSKTNINYSSYKNNNTLISAHFPWRLFCHRGHKLGGLCRRKGGLSGHWQMDRSGQRFCLRREKKLEEMGREQRCSKLHAEKLEFPHKQLFSVLGLLHLMGYKFKEVKPELEKPKPWAVAQAQQGMGFLVNIC